MAKKDRHQLRISNIDEETERKIRARRKKRIVLSIISVAIVIVAIIALNYYYTNKAYEQYSVIDKKAIETTKNCKYYSFGDGLLEYTDDGISYMNKGNTEWNQAYEMKKPIIDICNNTMAIADLRSTTIYIYGETGHKGTVETVNPILKLSVSEQGVIAAITETAETNRIEIFDRKGNSIAAGQSYLLGDGCPADISISNDGTKLAVSYVYVKGGTAKSRVVFYNYSEVGKNEVGRIVGGFEQYEQSLVSRIEFVTNDLVIAVADDMYTIYDMVQKPKIIHEEKLDKKIKSVFYNEESYGFVLENESLDKPYTVQVRNYDGKELFSKKTDMLYTGVTQGKEWVALYNEEELMILNNNGIEKIRTKINEGILVLLSTDRMNRYYVITNTSEIIEIKFK